MKHCSVCLEEKPIEDFHKDYTNPLDVIWLCKRHHTELHKRFNV